MIRRLVEAFEAAVETVINAAVDRIVEAWVEAEQLAICGEPTNGKQH